MKMSSNKVSVFIMLTTEQNVERVGLMSVATPGVCWSLQK